MISPGRRSSVKHCASVWDTGPWWHGQIRNFVSSLRNPPHEYSHYWRSKQKLLIIITHTQKLALTSVILCCSIKGPKIRTGQCQVRVGHGISATVGSPTCDKQWLWQLWTDRTRLSEQLHVKACENSRLQRREEKRQLWSELLHTHHSFGGYWCTT